MARLEDIDRLRLTENTLFAALPAEPRAEAIGRGRLATLAAEENLFEQGAPIDGLYILLDGCAKLLQVAADGEQVILRLVTPGEFTAAVAALDRVRRFPVTCRALTPVRVAFWPREEIRAIVAGHPALAGVLMSEIADRAQEMQRRFRQTATAKVPSRLAGLLLRLADQVGKPVKGGTLIDLPLTREEMSQMVGTTLYTVSRLLSEWAEAGWIEVGRQRVVVGSVEALRRLAVPEE